MSYYNRKDDAVAISTKHVKWAVLILAVLIGGFMVRDTVRSMMFGNELVQDEQVRYEQAQLPVTADVEGEWLGVITEDYDAETRYEYRLTFDQNDDGTVTGYMHLESTNRAEEIIADSMISGSINSDILTFSETRVTYLDGVPASMWCRISVTLDHEVVSGLETMTGSWVGIDTPGVGSCAGITGRVILTREQ